MGSLISHPQATEVHSVHCPSPNDVFAVRNYLVLFLPLEIVNIILDVANYWPKIITSSHAVLHAHASLGQANIADWCYLVTQPIPQRERQAGEDTEIRTKVKKIRFWMSSRDQGWGGEPAFYGTYQCSWTWFEAAILRPPANGLLPGWLQFAQREPIDLHSDVSTEGDPHPFSGLAVQSPDGKERWHIQSNVLVSPELLKHEVIWVEGGDFVDISVNNSGSGKGTGFVDLLRAGDRIAVLVKAMYPGWVNEVHGVTVEVLYSV